MLFKLSRYNVIVSPAFFSRMAATCFHNAVLKVT